MAPPSITQGISSRYAPVRQGLSSTALALGDMSMAPPTTAPPMMRQMPPVATAPQTPMSPWAPVRQRFQPPPPAGGAPPGAY